MLEENGSANTFCKRLPNLILSSISYGQDTSTKILYDSSINALQKSKVSGSSLKCLLTLAKKKTWQEYFTVNS